MSYYGPMAAGVTTGYSPEPPTVETPGGANAGANAEGAAVRVVAIMLGAAVGLWGLRKAGFRFNVGVSG